MVEERPPAASARAEDAIGLPRECVGPDPRLNSNRYYKIRSLKDSVQEKDLLPRNTRQFDSQEDRLHTLTKEISELQEKHTQAQAQLDKTVHDIALEENF